MNSKIIIRKSFVPGRVPDVAELMPGELAYNVADGKLYALKGDLALSTPITITGIETPHVAITSISNAEWDEDLGKFTAQVILTGDYSAWIEEHDRIEISESTTQFKGLYYVVEAEYRAGENETDIIIICEEGTTGGTDGELRKYGEQVAATVHYDSADPVALTEGDTIRISNSIKYNGNFTVIAHDDVAKEINIVVFNYDNEGSVGATLIKYDFEIVAFFSTSESLKQELITEIVSALDVQMQRSDPTDPSKVTSVRLVRKDLQTTPGT